MLICNAVFSFGISMPQLNFLSCPFPENLVPLRGVMTSLGVSHETDDRVSNTNWLTSAVPKITMVS